MQVQAVPRLSVEEYIKIEQENNAKYEYHNGEIFAMAGGSPNHLALCSNVNGLLWNTLKGSECRSLTTDAKIYIQKKNKYVYPDSTVICGKPELSEEVTGAYTNPTVIIEVLSPSTAAYDRGDKFRFYRQIPTLREYVLISQESYEVDVFMKPNGSDIWQVRWFNGIDDVVILPSIDVEISMRDLYMNVEMEVA